MNLSTVTEILEPNISRVQNSVPVIRTRLEACRSKVVQAVHEARAYLIDLVSYIAVMIMACVIIIKLGGVF